MDCLWESVWHCSVLELDSNEAAISLCLVRFSSWPNEDTMLAVGTTQGMTFYPRQLEGGLLRLNCLLFSSLFPCMEL